MKPAIPITTLLHAASLLQMLTGALLLRHGPIGAALGFALAALAAWMWRGTLRAHAVNSLVLPFPIGFFLAFRGEPGFLLLACASGATFLASLLYVRAAAAARRSGGVGAA